MGNKICGMVYSMTNSACGNKIIAFYQNPIGALTRLAAYNTGGNGTGAPMVDPLGSQGSIILSCDKRFLFVVNAGSNSISSFRVSDRRALALVDVIPSGGIRPNSLAASRDVLYVTNLGDAAHNVPSNIAGFHVGKDGCLIPIPGSIRPLSTANAQPTCVVASPCGRKIVISEQNNNRLAVFLTRDDGTLAGPVVHNSSGAGPFGSVFLSKGALLVTEAGTNALSSYSVNSNGTLDSISASVPNFQPATCWVALSPHEHFAFTSNAGGHTITTYCVGKGGTLSALNVGYSTFDGTGAPIDSGVSNSKRILYVLNGNKGSISAFLIGKKGNLKRLQVLEDTGLPKLGAQGLAVWDAIP